MSDTETSARRAALDAYFARAAGPGRNGSLADYVQRLRRDHWVLIDQEGVYMGCACREITCDKGVMLAWVDEQPAQGLAALPKQLFVGANRYDTDDTHVLHLWDANGQSFDVNWAREI